MMFKPVRSVVLSERDEGRCSLSLAEDGGVLLDDELRGPQGTSNYRIRIEADQAGDEVFDELAEYLSAQAAPIWALVRWLRARRIAYEVEAR